MSASTPSSQTPFPWHIPIYDAHCHPTDTMSLASSIPHMKTRCLSVMATRGQDQHLVAQIAKRYGIRSRDHAEWVRDECVVPCFGWHPWFAHLMYLSDDNHEDDDNDDDDEDLAKNDSAHKSKRLISQAPLEDDAKIAHYTSVFQLSRPSHSLSTADREILASLPNPTSFAAFLDQTRNHLQAHPLALVGEIGLDRAFRVPEAWVPELEAQRDQQLTPGGREGRRLTSFRCSAKHQKAVFTEQLRLAAETGRAVSVHGVQAHGMLFETMRELWVGWEREVMSKRKRRRRAAEEGEKRPSDGVSKEDAGPKAKPFPPRICLHSYSGDASNLKQYLHPSIPIDFFVSFSSAINLGDALDSETPESFAEVVRTVPDSMVLVESDLHQAGQEMDRRMEDIVRRVCEVKGWELEEGVEILGRNWRRFVLGVEE